ncbi:TPA: hypothetical protein EYQ19_01350, partial [Candidatus Pacearchaeota archaeon]|nr:hypothetical protein [Candidatus Pacearchaeota archaeon]
MSIDFIASSGNENVGIPSFSKDSDKTSVNSAPVEITTIGLPIFLYSEIIATSNFSFDIASQFFAKHFLTTPLKRLAIMVLVDRNHNRYPVKADYVGLSLATTLQEY